MQRDDMTIAESFVPTAPAEGPMRDVEELQSDLASLLREREGLRAAGADHALLERNRLSIVGAQWDLSRALIARYHVRAQVA
jgi:hypothetical protein